MSNQSEVILTIQIRGMQASRGQYTHYHRVEKDGKETNGVRIDKAPIYCKSYKTVHLGQKFIDGALAEAPSHVKMRPKIWQQIPEKKRIAIHVGSYVKAIHPEHRGYTVEIL